jgi:hypothetical protein
MNRRLFPSSAAQSSLLLHATGPDPGPRSSSPRRGLQVTAIEFAFVVTVVLIVAVNFVR